MSLNSALSIGRTALMTHQAAIEVTGNNLANAATRGYHRQTINLEPIRSQEIQTGIFVGRGVQVQTIQRQVNQGLEARLRNGISQEAGTTTRQDLLSQIEALQGEFSDSDLSSQLNVFFNSFSELANRPTDNSLRSLVVQQGSALASYVRNMRSGLSDIRTQVDQNIDAAVVAANDLLERIEQLNTQIVQQERGTGGASTLRDQRELLLGELSQYLDISVHEQTSGAADVFVGSLPIVLDGKSRGLEVRRETDADGQLQISVLIAADKSILTPTTGRLGALIATRQEDVNHALTVLDDFANQLIYQVNKVHSQGQGLTGFDSVTAANRVFDTSAALNTAAAGLDFTPTHGSFQINVTQKSTGQRVTSTINIDLDGLGSDTTLTSLTASLNGVSNVAASIAPDGRLTIGGDTADFEITFANDNSGALAALGINTFFTGGDAQDIDINSVVNSSPGLIAAGLDHVPGDNGNALALAALRDQKLAALGGLSLPEVWNRHVEDFAIRLGQTNAQLTADTAVRQNLESQQQAVSGVNVDEEAINLLAFQRAYQASARFLNVVNEMMDTLLGII
ncbi:MAG: flagellar hook-associated protein FlgK [Phycisphaeraceae bacterium]